MGHSHHNVDGSAGRRFFPQRACLRKGCQQSFSPRRPNQRYCQDPECLREVRRWLARKRQRHCRQSEDQRRRHCERERARRARIRQEIQASQVPAASSPPPTPRPARGHAAERISEHFCDRPGCYEPTSPSRRGRSCYCDPDCRTVMRRVLDRERKWLRRNTEAGRFKRQLEYQRQRRAKSDSFVRGSVSDIGKLPHRE